MNDRLYLHIPSLDELWYRQRIMSDPDTMSYNRGYDLSFSGYHKDTGCIDFPEGEWKDWYDYFIGREPERYYAYIARREDGTFIGEVNVHREPGAPWHEMGVVIEAKHRGMGYASEALGLLLRQAFEVLGADAVHNDFEDIRGAAAQAHLSAGFSEHSRSAGFLELIITKEQYNRGK